MDFLMEYLRGRREDRRKTPTIGVFLHDMFPDKTYEEVYTAISQVGVERVCADPLISDFSELNFSTLIPAIIKRLTWQNR